MFSSIPSRAFSSSSIAWPSASLFFASVGSICTSTSSFRTSEPRSTRTSATMPLVLLATDDRSSAARLPVNRRMSQRGTTSTRTVSIRPALRLALPLSPARKPRVALPPVSPLPSATGGRPSAFLPWGTSRVYPCQTPTAASTATTEIDNQRRACAERPARLACRGTALSRRQGAAAVLSDSRYVPGLASGSLSDSPHSLSF